MPTIDEIYTILAEIREELKLIKDEQKRLAMVQDRILTIQLEAILELKPEIRSAIKELIEEAKKSKQ